MPAKAPKEHPVVVLPVTGDGVTWETISREVTENAHRQWPDVKSDPYDEIVEQRKKTSYGNPEEVFETYETVRYRRYHALPPIPAEVKTEVKEKAKVTADK